MDSSVVVFFAGVVVGIAAVGLVLGLRRLRATTETVLPQGVTAPPSATGPPLEGALATAPAATNAPSHTRATVTTRITRTQIRFDGSAPNVVVDGQTYHSLAAVPEAARALVVDELRLALPNVSEAARPKVEAFIASAGGRPEPAAADR